MSDAPATPEGAFSSEGRKAKGEPIPLPEEPAPALSSIEKPRPPSLWQRHGPTMVVAAIVAAVVAGVVSIGVVWLGRRGGPDGRFVQDGTVMVPLDGEREVFYAVPFAGPPNLALDGNVNWNAIKLKEQKADRFTIQCTANVGFAAEVHWRAEGMRGPPPK